ncbi:tetratricopeptide repeat protein [Colwelliaceae bacterium 6471]
MNELLLSEISADEKSLLQSFVLIEEFIFSNTNDTLYQSLDTIIEQCQAAIGDIEEPIQSAEHLINELFVEHLLLDNSRAFWPVFSYQLQTGLDHRTIAPITKAAIICHIVEACGFLCDLVFVPEKIMVRIECDELYAIIFDPITGESLSWHELDNRMDELGGDPSDYQLPAMPTKSIVFEHISALKSALIRELAFDDALKCVDVLLAIRPDDPFERRDRGFLLHQLDCFKVAYDDYRFFVEQCPKDPAAQLLKIQLDNINVMDTVLH